MYSIAVLLITGSEPGRPRQTGQTAEFGSAPKVTGVPQNILVTVPSSTCVSRPITGSYLLIARSNGTGLVTVVVIAYRPASVASAIWSRPRACVSSG